MSGEAAPYGSSGTLKEWDDEVGTHAKDNPYLIFAICCGFSGPLLAPLELQGIGFNYLGDSTTGKSTALRVGSSLWAPSTYMVTWKSTPNRLELIAMSRSDCLLAIDENHLVDVQTLDQALYQLALGQGKARMKRDTSAAQTARWCLPILSSGERSLETRLEAAHRNPQAGQFVRFADIPVEEHDGIFHRLPEGVTAAAFSDMLQKNAAKTYGTAGPAFVERLIKELPQLSLENELKTIVGSHALAGLSAQQQRVWRAFALVGLAGELAISWEIVQWDKGAARQATRELFIAWLKAQPESSKSKEHVQTLQRVLDFIERHGDTRFTDIRPRFRTVYDHGVPVDVPSEEQPSARDRAGWWKDVGGCRIYLFTSGALHEAIGDLDFIRALRALDEAGAFVEKGTDNEKAKRHRTPDGGNPRLYWIDPEKLSI